MDNSEQLERLERKIDTLVKKDRIKTWAFIALAVLLAIALTIAGVKLKQAYNAIELTLSEYEELGEILKGLDPDTVSSITETFDKLQGLDLQALNDAMDKLKAFDPEALDKTMEKLRDLDPEGLNEAIDKLKNFDPDSLNEAVEKLKDFDPEALNETIEQLQQTLKKIPAIFRG